MRSPESKTAGCPRKTGGSRQRRGPLSGSTTLALSLLMLLPLAPATSWGQEVPAPRPPPSPNSSPDLTTLSIEQLANLKVSTATRSLEDIEKTGASVTVITEDQIRRMGARNLFDILQIVPGLGITQNFIGRYEIESRGIKTLYSEKVLVLLDGHSINNQLINGGFQSGFAALPVENVKRVEVVRGPGSALYGTNAFLAVINLITKDAEDVHGAVVTLAPGSYGTLQPNLLFGKTVGDTAAVINYNYFQTDGFRGFQQRDFSGASGREVSWENKHDLDVKLGREPLSFHGHFALRKSGPYFGATNRLNDESKLEYRDWFVELKSRHPVSGKLTVEPRVYYDNMRLDNFFELFSEGAFGGAFPDGVLARNAVTTSKLGAEILGHYDVKETNKAVFGISVEHHRDYDPSFQQNFDPRTFTPLPGGYQDVTNDPNLQPVVPHSRDLYAVFAEDIWDLRPDLRLILGGRFDHYSDFGGTFNPRTSLTWEFKEGYHLRFLYGSAFREPTFGELYNKNNPIVVGNPDLKPEEIQTYEVGISGKLTSQISARITGFHNDLKNLIRQGNPNVNTGSARVTGAEFELSYSFRPASSVGLNYTFQDAEDLATHRRTPNTPKHRANLILRLGLPEDWSLFTLVQLKGSTVRASGDPRAERPGYGLDNVTISSGKRFLGTERLQFSFSVFNLFDKDYADPSPPGPAGIANSDYPRPGREFSARISYRL